VKVFAGARHEESMKHEFDPFDPDAWADGPGCEPFEIAMEMRAQGALAPSAVEVLESHLAACPSCGAHAARTGAVDAALAAITPTPPDWKPVEQRIAESVRRYRRLPWQMARSLLVGTIVCAGIYPLVGLPLPSIWLLVKIFAIVMVFFGAVYYWNVRRRRILFAEHDIIAAYRKELEHSLLVQQRLGPWSLASLAIFGVNAAISWHSLQSGHATARYTLVATALCAASALVTLASRPRIMRRLRREIAELH
jgi:predicted anti-sigma-YlaC factor YlaD